MLPYVRFFTLSAVTLWLVTWGLPPLPARALSLQPVEETFELDGVPFKHWVFPDGAMKVTYTPPSKWQLIGNASSAMLYPPEGTRGDVKILLLPVLKDRAIGKPTLEAMARALRDSLPPESKDVSDLDAQANPVPVQNVPTGEVICAYSAFGQKFKKAKLVMNHPNYQLDFTFTASADVFDRLHQDWLKSMFSWEWQPAR